MIDRELFCAMLANAPLLESDAAIVLCGEDAEARLQTAAGLMGHGDGGARHVLLSCGKSDPPAVMSAKDAHKKALTLGLAPGKVSLENESQNTHEQAVACLSFAAGREWKRIILIASPYHQYRAFLTFLAVLQRQGLDKAIQMISLPASHVPWSGKPEGVFHTRLELLEAEFAKCDEYGEHVATWREGIEYLTHWERANVPGLETP